MPFYPDSVSMSTYGGGGGGLYINANPTRGSRSQGVFSYSSSQFKFPTIPSAVTSSGGASASYNPLTASGTAATAGLANYGGGGGAGGGILATDGTITSDATLSRGGNGGSGVVSIIYYERPEISGGQSTLTTSFGVAASSASSLVTTCHNKTGAIIPKMSVVYIDGRHGNLPSIVLAQANNESNSSKTYGITATQISDNSSGSVIVIGLLIDVNTDQFAVAEGSVLYLSPTIPGALTPVKPTAPDHMVSVAKIIRNHVNQGSIEVSIQNGFELQELHNVAVSGVTSGQFLQYNNGSGLWVPSSSGNFSTLLVNGTGVSVNGHSHVSNDITDFNSAVSGLLPSKYPTVVQLGSVSVTINTNASLGDIFDLTLAASGTLANPSGSVDGQTLRWRISYNANSLVLNFGNQFKIPSSATSPLPLSSTSGNMDILGATYDSSRSKWDIIAFVPGY
jgi:hypothetical protein